MDQDAKTESGNRWRNPSPGEKAFLAVAIKFHLLITALSCFLCGLLPESIIVPIPIETLGPAAGFAAFRSVFVLGAYFGLRGVFAFPVGSRLRWSALVCLSIYTVLLLIDAIQIGDRIYHGELSFRLIKATWKTIFGIR